MRRSVLAAATLAVAPVLASAAPASAAPPPLKVWVIEGVGYEGNPGDHVRMAFNLRLNRPSDVPVSVGYATTSWTAYASQGDYTGVKGRVTFPPGEVNRPVFVPITGDLEVEPDERFALLIDEPSAGLQLGHGGATGWILNDDGRPGG